MNTKNSTPGILFGLTVLVGLMPLSFTFSQNGAQLLLDTSFKYIVWCGQAVILLLILLTKFDLSKNQLIVITVLYVLIPFVFTFNDNGVTFLILNT